MKIPRKPHRTQASELAALLNRLRQWCVHVGVAASIITLVLLVGASSSSLPSIAHTVSAAHSAAALSVPIARMHPLCPGSFAPC
jgi:hypothetical protein